MEKFEPIILVPIIGGTFLLLFGGSVLLSFFTPHDWGKVATRNPGNTFSITSNPLTGNPSTIDEGVRDNSSSADESVRGSLPSVYESARDSQSTVNSFHTAKGGKRKTKRKLTKRNRKSTKR